MNYYDAFDILSTEDVRENSAKTSCYTEFFIFVMYRPTSIVIGMKLIDVSDLVR